MVPELIFIIAGVHRSLESIRSRVGPEKWRAFVEACQARLSSAGKIQDLVALGAQLQECLELLQPTAAGPIIRQIVKRAQSRARQTTPDRPIAVTFRRGGGAGTQTVRVRLDPAAKAVVQQAADLLVTELALQPGDAAAQGWSGSWEGLETKSLRSEADFKTRLDATGRGPIEEQPTQPERASLDDYSFNAWIEERERSPDEPLNCNETYTACFNVGADRSGNMVPVEQRRIRWSDVPVSGLETVWVISSTTVKLLPHPDDPTVEVSTAVDKKSGLAQWMARFTGRIDRNAPTPVRRVGIVPLTTDAPRLSILVFARAASEAETSLPSEVYRDMTVELRVISNGSSSEPHRPGIRRMESVTHVPCGHLGLRPQQDWQSPPETLTIMLSPPQAFVHGTSGGKLVGDAEKWMPALAVLEPKIEEAQKALDKLRSTHQAYFDDLDGFSRRLGGYKPVPDWALAATQTGHERDDLWDQVARSKEMRRLASVGSTLYQELFPRNSALRGYLRELRLGARLDIHWMKQSSSTWIAHVPWSLLYINPPPTEGEPVDPKAFLGLRLRLAYKAHSLPGRSKALGKKDQATLACILYWGQGDETASETERHRAALQAFAGGRFIPEAKADPKRLLLEYLRTPGPSPVAVLYFYCQCKAGTGASPELRFGQTADEASVLEEFEFPKEEMPDQPLVFVNACDSVGAHAYTANMLEQVFAYRNCRAFIGTECKVPIKFASHFGVAFLHFLYRPDAQGFPTSAGEAFVQARRFFWDEYRNPGGLFYSYVNQYELYLGDDGEVAGLRDAHT